MVNVTPIEEGRYIMSLNLNYKPEVVVETENLSREEWLQYRRQGIGGSDVAAIMGVSPFCTKRDLYYDKVGIKPAMDEEESNWVAKEVGHRLEDLVAEIFSRKTGLTVFPIRKMFRHPLYPFMLADVDFFIRFPDGSIGILECKTTNYNCQSKWENDSVPINYEYQGRHYMSVMNINKVYFACLYGNNEDEFIIRCMERDLELEEEFIAEEEFFWEENVAKRIEPPYVEKPDLVLESIRKHFGSADKDADEIKLSRKHLAGIQNYMELKKKKSQLDSEARKLEERMKESYMEIIEELGVSCSGILRDGNTEYIVTYNPSYRTTIDKKSLERLKIHHPDVYDDYVSTTESRRFAVKMKGAA